MSDSYSGDAEALDDADDSESRQTTPDDEVTVHPDEADREFDYRGWALVGAIFLAFLVIPGIIFLYPHVGPMLGLTFWDTYLALPMVPAILLGILAVWATTRP
ncbi:MAG: hypothetical protein ACI8UR_002034 [Natronomonas sp.]|jgi:hypothetical protein|uniref:hypothetical protein n=1 Tax=Natronomonas sp. TaxID=2184060 RepID=UPI003989D09D